MPQTDVLIIGSGIAGLSVAIKVAERFPDRQCIMITKQESAESNTRYAQGGIAVVSDLAHDSFEAHIADTLAAGDGLCDPAVVEHVVLQAPERLRELMQLGADFDRDESGELILGREGGHNANRIIHHRDITGLNISTALLKKVSELPNIIVMSHHVAIDLITSEDVDDAGKSVKRCCGAWVLSLDTNRIEGYGATVTVLATGGIGQVYETTTNPLIATGDGIAMAFRAGANISNMEFVQFHPTAFYSTKSRPAFLVSEALRGQGAYLRNHSGERFLFRYHNDGELARRDVVSRAIATEIELSGTPFVHMDCTHIPTEALRANFPNIFSTCLSRGVDISKEYIPVAPAAHYLCGGIDTNLSSRTSIHNLYACGECANTGLHGANRLASNSLLEAVVFAHNCVEDISRVLAVNGTLFQSLPEALEASASVVSMSDIDRAKRSVQTLMSQFAGIVRSNQGLMHAQSELTRLQSTLGSNNPLTVQIPEWHELRSMVACGLMVVEQSRRRSENKGGFYNRSLELDHVLS